MKCGSMNMAYYNYDVTNNVYRLPVRRFPGKNVRGNYASSAISFRSNDVNRDGFNQNSLHEWELSREDIEDFINSNPKISQILNDNGISVKVNMKAFKELQNGHLANSRIYTAKIYSALPKEIKAKVSLADLQLAAVLHDYGKILIPEDILYKKGALTEAEMNIMKLHSQLGYELLKLQDIKPGVLSMIKYHHQNINGTGYPKIESDYENSIGSQILLAADKYSALTEERSYKPAMPRIEALKIMQQDVNDGILSPVIFSALCRVT